MPPLSLLSLLLSGLGHGALKLAAGLLLAVLLALAFAVAGLAALLGGLAPAAPPTDSAAAAVRDRPAAAHPAAARTVAEPRGGPSAPRAAPPARP